MPIYSGKYRREISGTTGCTSDFFDPDNVIDLEV